MDIWKIKEVPEINMNALEDDIQRAQNVKAGLDTERAPSIRILHLTI